MASSPPARPRECHRFLLFARRWRRLADPLLTAVVLASTPLYAQVAEEASEVAAVSGPSWLQRLEIDFEETSMGHTGAHGPPPSHRHNAGLASTSASVPELAPPDEPLRLTGADIYRLSCRGCHGADGRGAEPEIKSLIDPVRATSVAMTMEKMEARGISIERSFAEELAVQSEQALVDRLENGGEKMPPFGYLSRRERDALEGFLGRLAGIPDSKHPDESVSEPSTRVGELLVKGTCHICHGATGSWPAPQALLKRAIPSLASLVERDPAHRFIRKVRSGESIVMGELQLDYRGRMPVFRYLKDQEVFAAYLYLLAYPPKP